MTADVTAASHPQEYEALPLYDRLPTPAAIQRMEGGMTAAEATKDDLPAAVRATLQE